MAQNIMGPVTGNQGIVTQGQTGNNTILNVAPARAQFTNAHKAEILQRVPKNIPVTLQTIGGNADQEVGNEVHNFLLSNGYAVERAVIGVLAPPPDKPFTADFSPTRTVLIIAPSAR